MSISTNRARKYFKDCGLSYSDINISSLIKLREIMVDNCNGFVTSHSDCIKVERFKANHINFDSDGYLLYAFLKVKVSWGDVREAISFNRINTAGEYFIGFCGSLSTCNSQPIMRAFISWCDILQDRKLKGVKNEN